jgi:hypothetical protein
MATSGTLAIELAEALSSEQEVKSIIARAEHDALMAARSLACLPEQPPPSKSKSRRRALDVRFHEEATRTREYIAALKFAYDSAVQDLPGHARALLDDSIKHSEAIPGKIVMVSKEPHPFVPYSAPIHKLMIAHALQGGYVLYQSGQLDVRGRSSFLLKSDGTMEKVKNAFVIARHGAHPGTMLNLIREEELKSLRVRQTLMADYIDIDEVRSPHPPKDYPTRGKHPERFIAARYGMAKDLVKQIAPDVRLTAYHSGFRYEHLPTQEEGGSPPERACRTNYLG